MYCPSKNTTQLNLKGTSRTKNSNNITIMLHVCDLYENINCLIDATAINMLLDLSKIETYVKLYILDHQINPSEK